ncbi:secretin N-terminal domain-containing protein [Planctobacterium marinum]|uniref:secretin N-terminal domain-containing protein n=1 Tax=Planctobacterium marinum TaxID=1631968 RepID=UPI001E378C42|nr:secretin N-terminal domain-containing protein [Planctobacterium marinum]MCC2606151.1 hypothetical protein [Planctobacterium marinum]
MDKILQHSICSTIIIMVLTACSTTQQSSEKFEPTRIGKSYLYDENGKLKDVDGAVEAEREERTQGFKRLQSIGSEKQNVVTRKAIDYFEKNEATVTFAADSMPVASFIHYIFGEILKANYVIGPDVKNDKQTLTLNVSETVTKAQVYDMVAELLSRNQISIDFESNTFFFQKAALSRAKAAIGIGNTLESIPQTNGQILQIIPLKYGIKLAVERTLGKMIDAEITADVEQSSLFVLSDRLNVVRAIELINLLDVPANRGKHIGLLSLKYISTENYLLQIADVLRSEGIVLGVGYEQYKNVLLVPLPQVAAIAVFSPDEALLNRVRYWSNILDQPSKGENVQYFVYTPRYARAADIGESVGQLLTLGGPSLRKNRTNSGANAQQLEAETQQGEAQKTTFSSSNVSFVVDERSNSLIFSTTGSTYNNLLPLLNKLDILPKQIILEVMIAEVTLSDEFRYGVEWALRNNSEVSGSGTFGSFTQAIGSTNFTWLGDSTSQVTASFFRENSFVNVISNPSLLVRDGVSAAINVGTQIPVQAGTVVDDGVTSTNVQYRDTGVDVSVTPTVNAQGVVIMNINLNISNTVAATADSSTPSIFQRTLSTEAVVTSGQTVILGGLISENASDSDTKVPFLSELPLVGEAFKGKSKTSTKTELVMLVTPKVLESNEEWQKLLSDFQNQVQNVQFVQ